MTDVTKSRLTILTDAYLQLEKKLLLGGGPEKIEKIHKQGKLTARERIDLLLAAGRVVIASLQRQLVHEMRHETSLIVGR